MPRTTKAKRVRQVTPAVLTLEEASEYCRVSPGTMKSWVAKGLKCFRGTKTQAKRGPQRLLFRLITLDRWLETMEASSEVSSASAAPLGSSVAASARPRKGRAALPPKDDPDWFLPKK